jgi:hypothetical protein
MLLSQKIMFKVINNFLTLSRNSLTFTPYFNFSNDNDDNNKKYQRYENPYNFNR